MANRGNVCNLGAGVMICLALVFGALGVSPQEASATMIEEISVDSIDTAFDASTGILTMSQFGTVDLVIERVGNTQDSDVITGLDFILVTTMVNDASSGEQAVASFAGGTITIMDSNTHTFLFTADIGNFVITETIFDPDPFPYAYTLLVGMGDFDVTGGTLAPDFAPAGIVIEIAWILGEELDSFDNSFNSESNVTLTPEIPEPATMSLLALGGLAVLARRRRRNA